MFAFHNGYSQEQEALTGSGRLTPSFGIRGGINFSNLYVDGVEDQNVKTGIVIGLYAKLPLTKGISFQPELLYSNKGAQLTYSNFVQGQGVYRFNLNYIEAPMTFSLNIIKNFNIHAGGYVAYLASANVKDVQEGTIIGVTELNEDNFNRFDYGLICGLGVDIGKFGIGARYNYGLNQIGQSGSLAGDLTRNSKNSTLALYVAFGF
jgi:hypothetical protein